MTSNQFYDACVEIAPDFRVGIEFLTVGRVLAYHGTPSGRLSSQNGAMLFPEGSAFEPKLSELLNAALVTLQGAR